MSVYNTDKAVYSPSDFQLWLKNGILEITPKFQRRPVWRTPARSYFIDTILRGMTVPPIYLRIAQNDEKKKVVRQVVDGQQRVRSVLEFMEDKYRLSKNLKSEWKGKKYSQLPPEQQQQIADFGFTAEIFKGISDQQILEVFCRLNMNGVALNKQELRNGKFFGLFKQTAYSLALSYLEFWRHHKVFSEQAIARMLEVELTSELLIAGSIGMQDKKSSIDTFYDDHEDKYANQSKDERRFAETIEAISETFNGDLASSAFRRPPLFYSLYCVVYHHLFGLPEIKRQSPRKKLTDDQRSSLQEAVIKLSEVIAISKSKEPDIEVPARYVKFVAACQQQTDNLIPRKVRFDTLYDEAF